MSKTVAIFGAGGKLGRRVLALLAERGWPVRALVHRTPVEGSGITSIQGSITDPKAVEETVRGADLVVQLATTKEDADTFSGLFWTGQQAIELGLADQLGSLDYVAREIVKTEDIIDYTRRENVAERLAKKFGAAIGDGAIRTLKTVPAVR